MKQEAQSTAGSPRDTLAQANVFAEALRGKESEKEQWGTAEENKKLPDKPKEKPNLGLSGALTADTNTYKVHNDSILQLFTFV